MQPRSAAALAVGIGILNLGNPGTTTAAQSRAALQTVAITQTSDSTAIAFHGISMTSMDPSADGMEVAIHFGSPLQQNIATELERISGSIAAASTGYDSLLLRTQGPALFDSKSLPNGFVVNVKVSKATSDNERLATVEIRRLTLADDIDAARALLFKLRSAQPDDADLYRLEADVDAADKSYRTAAQKYAYLLAANPGDESLQQSLRASQTEFAPRVEVGAEAGKIQKADRQFKSFVQASFDATQGMMLRGRMDYVELEDNIVQFADGTTGPFAGERYTAQLDAIFDIATRWQGTLSAYGSEDDVGAGATLSYEDASSMVALTVAYHQPTWDYPESIVAKGTLDSARLSVSKSFADTWYFNFAAIGRQYNLLDETGTATSTAIEAEVRWALPLESSMKATLGYSFDGEFAENVSLRPDGFGGSYALLPLADRVVHAADLRVAGQLSTSLRASLSGGYAYDISGESGAIASAELAFSPADDLIIALNAYYSGLSDRAGETGAYSHAGVTITRIFATTDSIANAR